MALTNPLDYLYSNEFRNSQVTQEPVYNMDAVGQYGSNMQKSIDQQAFNSAMGNTSGLANRLRSMDASQLAPKYNNFNDAGTLQYLVDAGYGPEAASYAQNMTAAPDAKGTNWGAVADIGQVGLGLAGLLTSLPMFQAQTKLLKQQYGTNKQQLRWEAEDRARRQNAQMGATYDPSTGKVG